MPVFPLKDPLQGRLATLPRILAGPILRRVDANSVSVWVALFKSATVTLTVVGDQNNPAGSTLMQATVNASSPSQITVSPNLSFVCITATSTTPLVTNRLYYYSMTIDGAALDAAGVLNTAGGTSARGIVALPGNVLPSFCLPSAQFQTNQNGEGLRVAHASCRKAHAESLDAMLALDLQLRASAKTVSQRPQQLFLTGDQIYADDVADAFLAVLTDAGDTLLGSQEVLPPTSKNVTGQFLVPGKRATTMTKGCHFSSEAADSHLITLGEFFAMYLLSFSDVLWPASLPAFADLFPVADNPDVYSTRQKTYPAIKGQPAKTVTIQHPWFKKYTQQTTDLASFKKALPRVRLVFANIATYMMADDHEVTDDWYMNRAWIDQVFNPSANDSAANPALAGRVIQNGLLSYAIFQHWGNRPAALLQDPAWTALRTSLPSWITNKFPASGTEITTFASALSIPQPNLGTITEIPRTGSFLTWSYAIRWSIHELLAVDNRTRRGYADARTEPVIFSQSAVQTESDSWAADLQGAPALPANGVTFAVLASPIVGIPLIEFAKRQGLSDPTATFQRDVESMDISAAAFDSFLAGFAARPAAPTKLVLLTGDVHFGYAASIQYWQVDANGNQIKHISIGNITSSALKNQTTDAGLASTVRLHENGYGIVVKVSAPNVKTRFTWSATGASAGSASLAVGTGVPKNPKASSPATVSATIDRAYASGAVAVIEDTADAAGHYTSNTLTLRPRSVTATKLYPVDGGADRGLSLTPLPPITATDKSARATAKAAAQQEAITNAQKAAAGTQLVGVNNLGIVTFTADASGNPTATIQELWWWLDKAAVLVDAYLGSAATADPPAPKAYSHFTVPFLNDPVPSTTILK